MHQSIKFVYSEIHSIRIEQKVPKGQREKNIEFVPTHEHMLCHFWLLKARISPPKNGHTIVTVATINANTCILIKLHDLEEPRHNAPVKNYDNIQLHVLI